MIPVPLLLSILLSGSGGTGQAVQSPLTTTFATEAKSVSASIEDRFWDPKRRHYSSFVSASDGRGGAPAFCWDMAIYLSSLAAASKFDRKTFQPLFDRAFGLLQAYANLNHGVFGYSDFPRSKPDRYYDDNEWVMLAFLDMHAATHDAKYLLEAKKLWPFIQSGTSSLFGNGIYWKENEPTTKNTCSNAPAIAAATELFLATKEEKYVEVAIRLHRWIEMLKDRDNLMWDHVGPNGDIGRTKWSYNRALMIRSDLLLYRATHSKSYLTEAVNMGAASVKCWVDPETGAIHDESSFAHHLSEAFLMLGQYDHSKNWRGIANRATSYAYTHSEQGGLYGSRWDRYVSDGGKVILRYQASMARALWMAAGHKA